MQEILFEQDFAMEFMFLNCTERNLNLYFQIVQDIKV